jgi:prepilin-type N-terminal cleavage/methylation domain-containing protein
MKYRRGQSSDHSRGIAPRSRQDGFTLIELMVATVLFLVVGGTAFSLFRRHAPVFSQQQSQVGLNIALRNAVSQMQIDVANAGTGFYTGADVPGWPVGVTIVNNPAPVNCFNAATRTYGPTCFDTLNVIATDEGTPPAHPSAATDTTLNTISLTPPAPLTAAQYAANFTRGDQVLLVSANGFQVTTTVLTANGVAAGAVVQLTHNGTRADGTNTAANDPLSISLVPIDNAAAGVLGSAFTASDWVLKLSPITYSVDTTNPANPQLTRRQGGVTNAIAEQVIGFKLGASVWNGATTSTQFYDFNAAAAPPFGYGNDFSSIRAVRVSLIGRTPPINDATYTYRNQFDGGPYPIEAISVVINPRNLSMRDSTE